MADALALLKRDGAPTREAQQLQWIVCSRYGYKGLHALGTPEEQSPFKAMLDELSKNTALRKDPMDECMQNLGTLMFMVMQVPFAWNAGRVMTDDVIYEAMVYSYETGMTPYIKRAISQTIGARREAFEMTKNVTCVYVSGTPAAGHTTKQNVAYVRAVTDAEWGEDNEKLMDSLLCINFKRHHEIGRSSVTNFLPIFQVFPGYVAEKTGDLQQLLDLFNHQRQYAEAYVSAIEPFSADSNVEDFHFCLCGCLVGVETTHFYPFREKLLRAYQLGGLATAQEMQDAYEQFPTYRAFLDGGFAVNDDGLVRAFSFFSVTYHSHLALFAPIYQHHFFHPHYMVTCMFAAFCLASPEPSGIDMSYMGTLPLPDAPTLHCVWFDWCTYASARVMMGELLEQEGCHTDAIAWGQAELQVQACTYLLLSTFLTQLCLSLNRIHRISTYRPRHEQGDCWAGATQRSTSTHSRLQHLMRRCN
jgi:hypothetical protein